MEKRLRLRFLAREKAFIEALTSIKQEMSARGVLYSGTTVKRGHDALVAELVESRKIIVATMTETLRVTKPHSVRDSLTTDAIDLLRQRKDFLERFYLEHMKPVASQLQNKASLEPYTNLSGEIDLNEKELEVDLAREIDSYLESQGATLYDRVRNQFLNRPLVVIGGIAIAVVMIIFSFIGALSVFAR